MQDGMFSSKHLIAICEFAPPYLVINPEIFVETGSLDLNDSVEKVINYLKEQNFIGKF